MFDVSFHRVFLFFTRLVRARRLERKHSVQLAVQEAKSLKLQAARSLQADLARRSGKATKAKLEHVSPATKPAMHHLSELLNEAMAERYAGQGGISPQCLWYRFFKELDEDASGRMLYDELEHMVRTACREVSHFMAAR